MKKYKLTIEIAVDADSKAKALEMIFEPLQQVTDLIAASSPVEKVFGLLIPASFHPEPPFRGAIGDKESDFQTTFALDAAD